MSTKSPGNLEGEWEFGEPSVGPGHVPNLWCDSEGVPFPTEPQLPHSSNEEVGLNDSQILLQFQNLMVLIFPQTEQGN